MVNPEIDKEDPVFKLAIAKLARRPYDHRCYDELLGTDAVRKRAERSNQRIVASSRGEKRYGSRKESRRKVENLPRS